MRRLVWMLVALAVLYVLWAVLIFVEQRRMMYVSWGEPVGEPRNLPHDLERSWIDVPGGRAEAWYLPPKAAPGARAPALIFAHGNGETIDLWPDELQGFRDLGLAVMLVEYPGYGRSSGEPTQESIRQAFLGAYDALAARPEIDPRRIVGFGRSLGGGAICQLLKERSLAATILMSTFPSTRIFASRYLVPGFLARDPFDNAAALRGYAGPVLVLHGEHDELVPYAQTAALLAAARDATLRSYSCGHECWNPNALPLWNDLGRFLGDHGLVGPSLASGPGV